MTWKVYLISFSNWVNDLLSYSDSKDNIMVMGGLSWVSNSESEHVDKINAHVMSLFPGKRFTYRSADTIAEENLPQAYPTKFLNSLSLSGLPPYERELKIGSPIMLLCNLHAGPGNGLCNGTQMIVIRLGHRVTEAEIASGVNKGKSILIPWITIVVMCT